MGREEKRTGTERPWIFLGVALISIMGALALWRLGSGRELAPAQPLPEDPAARAAMFRKHLRENPVAPDPESRKPVRKEWERWLAEHNAAETETAETEGTDQGQPEKRTPPPVFDFGTASLPRAPVQRAPERIEPNEFLDKEDLRHPEIFFEVAEYKPEYSTLEVQLDVHRFFSQYRKQLDGELGTLLKQGGNPDEIAEIRAALGRYDKAIEKIESLIAQHPESAETPRAR